MSEQTAQLVDAEVKRVIDEAYERAKDMLPEHLDLLRRDRGGAAGARDADREDIDMLARGEPLPPLEPAADGRRTGPAMAQERWRRRWAPRRTARRGGGGRRREPSHLRGP